VKGKRKGRRWKGRVGNERGRRPLREFLDPTLTSVSLLSGFPEVFSVKFDKNMCSCKRIRAFENQNHAVKMMLILPFLRQQMRDFQLKMQHQDFDGKESETSYENSSEIPASGSR